MNLESGVICYLGGNLFLFFSFGPRVVQSTTGAIFLLPPELMLGGDNRKVQSEVRIQFRGSFPGIYFLPHSAESIFFSLSFVFIFFSNVCLLNKIKYSYKTRKITYLIINLVKKDNPKGYTPADGLSVPMKTI